MVPARTQKDLTLEEVQLLFDQWRRDRKYVFVEGTFKAFKPDSFGPWSGYIKEIRRVEFTK